MVVTSSFKKLFSLLHAFQHNIKDNLVPIPHKTVRKLIQNYEILDMKYLSSKYYKNKGQRSTPIHVIQSMPVSVFADPKVWWFLSFLSPPRSPPFLFNMTSAMPLTSGISNPFLALKWLIIDIWVMFRKELRPE